MTISTSSISFVVGALGLGLLSAACIINTSEDGDGGPGTDSGDPPISTGQPSDSTGPIADDTVGTDTNDGTTGGPVGECTENLVLDPGFEAGTPSDAWTEASDAFGSPICDSSCTEEAGAVPYAGDWWAWFGGVEDMPETASVSQTITIDPEMAYLSFRFQIRSGANTGDDVFTATLGGDTVFMVNDQDMNDYDTYQRVDLDVSAWADGGSYELRFASEHTGVGLTSFFLDDVSLVSCIEAGSTGSTGPDTDGQDSTAGSSGGTDGTTGTGGTTGGTGTGTGTTGGSSG